MFSRRAYWTCQLAGWGAWTAINLGLYRGAAILWLGFCGLAFSHALRWVIRRAGWHRQLSLRVVGGAVGLAVGGSILLAVVNTIGLSYVMRATRQGINAYTLLYSGFVWFALLACWQAIYFGAHWFQRSKQAEVEAARLDLLVLRAQLNPHFLFNSLNSIRALILENPAGAQEAVTHLSSLLRYTLQAADRPSVSLAEEMEIVTEYLALEKVRFEERLRYRVHVPEEALGSRVPPMVLQILVENAIKHGIGRLTGGGEVVIQAELTGAQLKLLVSNPGRIEAAAENGGIGLRYARKCGFTLAESEGVVTAELVVPQ